MRSLVTSGAFAFLGGGCVRTQMLPLEGGVNPPPLHFLKTIEDIDMKLTPLIKRLELNLLLLSYLRSDVTRRH